MDLLAANEIQKVKNGEVLQKDYFYLPVIYYSEQNEDHEEDWYSLRFNEKTPPDSLLYYASKVTAGQTLWQAVRKDLESDFKYPHEKSFVIEEIEPLDSAKTKDGRMLTRLLVWVGVTEKFDTTHIHPVHTKPFWVHEGEHIFNLVANKYFADTPINLPFGKYVDANSLGQLMVLKHAVVDDVEPEDVYLVQDTNNLYCCFNMEGHSSGGPSSDPESSMREFLHDYYGNNYSLKMLTPKNKDWFITCYIARVRVKDE